MEDNPSTHHLPRILCLHGGGVNAPVFSMQCRAIIHHLRSLFRLVFVNAPFQCPPHPAIITVYGDEGPFYRWLRFADSHASLTGPEASRQIIRSLEAAMAKDPGHGEWVGLLGFSQGAKIAASLLWAQEHIRDAASRPLPGVQFRFGVLMAGSAPVVMIDPTGKLPMPRYIASASDLSGPSEDFPPTAQDDTDAHEKGGEHLIHVPTVHVHGLQDPGIAKHRILLRSYCTKGTTRLVEWNGDHRLPIKKADVDMVVEKLVEAATEAGVLRH